MEECPIFLLLDYPIDSRNKILRIDKYHGETISQKYQCVLEDEMQ